MRKLYWCCLGGGVLLLGGALTAAGVAVHHPQSFVGRAAYTASQFAAFFIPVANLDRAFARGQETCQCESVVTEGPAEVCEVEGEVTPRAPFEFGVVAEPALTDPIRIPEDEPIPAAPMPIGPDSRCPVQAAELALANAECPRGEHGLAALPTMPYCGEELCENSEASRDLLHMPRVEGADEEQEGEEVCPLAGVQHMLRLFEKMLRK